MRRGTTAPSVTKLSIPSTGIPRSPEIHVYTTQAGSVSISWDSQFQQGEAGREIFERLLDQDPRTGEVCDRLKRVVCRVNMLRQERINVSDDIARWLCQILPAIYQSCTLIYEKGRREGTLTTIIKEASESRSSASVRVPEGPKAGGARPPLRCLEAGSD